MTGNLQGKKATDGYADLTYRQPMKWKQGGAAGDGSNTCGYSISGSGANVKWDNINSTTTVKDAETQVADANSHYSTISKFAKVKSQTPALIKGAYEVNALEAGSSTGQYGVTITRTLGNESYKYHVNFSNSSLEVYNDSAVKSIPARSAILTKNGKVVASYNGVSGSATNNGSSGNSGDLVKGKLTINSLPTWITDAGCQIFAWVWGGDYGNGQWIECTYTSATSLEINLDKSATGMLLVRCVAGTTTPNWDVTGNNKGRIYNQTEDISLVSGKTTYQCSNWKEYNK
jgi:hypothetical protein